MSLVIQLAFLSLNRYLSRQDYEDDVIQKADVAPAFMKLTV